MCVTIQSKIDDRCFQVTEAWDGGFTVRDERGETIVSHAPSFEDAVELLIEHAYHGGRWSL